MARVNPHRRPSRERILEILNEAKDSPDGHTEYGFKRAVSQRGLDGRHTEFELTTDGQIISAKVVVAELSVQISF